MVCLGLYTRESADDALGLKKCMWCFADIEIQANEILHHKLTLNGYLSEFTGQPMERITQDTDRYVSFAMATWHLP